MIELMLAPKDPVSTIDAEAATQADAGTAGLSIAEEREILQLLEEALAEPDLAEPDPDATPIGPASASDEPGLAEPADETTFKQFQRVRRQW